KEALGLLGDIARVPVVGLHRQGVTHEAVQHQRLVLTERIVDGGCGIRDQDHVGLLNLPESPDRRSVESEAFLERLGGQLVGGHREMLDLAGQVTEAEIDEFDAVVGDSGQHVLGCGHGFLSGVISPELNRSGVSRRLSGCYRCVSIPAAAVLWTATIALPVLWFATFDFRRLASKERGDRLPASKERVDDRGRRTEPGPLASSTMPATIVLGAQWGDEGKGRVVDVFAENADF